MHLLQRAPDGLLSLVKVDDNEPPPYAILSHTWGADDQEIIFTDVNNTSLIHQHSLRQKEGYAKVDFCLNQAERDGFAYVWIDTCCINKDSLPETNRAINCMFRWYAAAEKCYVYLSDVTKHKRRHSEVAESAKWQDDFRSSRWFARGWTLQELLAPRIVEFYTVDGDLLGTKSELATVIESITRIDISALRGRGLSSFTTQERFNWALTRETKEPEDRVYSLFGILEVSFPPNYGEGQQAALQRLRTALADAYAGKLLILDFHQGYRDSDRVRNLVSTGPTRPKGADESAQWLKVVLKTLNFQQQDARKTNIKPPTAKTCDWLLQHRSWLKWRACEDDSRLIWIKGHPGAGKSTIMRYADEQAVNSQADSEVVISFYFNARGTLLERNVEGMYRSLLCQLIQAVGPYELAASAKALRSYRLLNLGGPWPVTTLQMLFGVMANNLVSRRLTMFIDALDECEDGDVREMLYYLEDLGLNSVESGGQLSMCFASRYYPTISLPSALELRLDQEAGHMDDIERYLDKTLRIGNDERAKSIKAKLLTKANGIFIWIVLVIRILNEVYDSGRTNDLAERLDRMPSDMSALFRQIIQRDRCHGEDLVLSLQWILFARYPLSPGTFLALMLASTNEEHLYTSVDDIMPDDTLRYLSHTTKGLAEVSNGRIQFVHETVRDFLLGDEGLAELWQVRGDVKSRSHERLKRICLDHLKTRIQRNLPPIDGVPNYMVHSPAGRHHHELASAYSILYLIEHAEAAAENISQATFLAGCDDAFRLSVRDQILWEYDLAYRNAWSQCPLLNFLVQFNAPRLVKTHLSSSKSGLEVKNEAGNTPLLAACGGKRTPAQVLPQVLLEYGADVQATNTQQQTALHLAVQNDAPSEVVNALLDAKADATAPDGEGLTALHYAFRNQDSDIFRLLRSRVGVTSALLPKSWSWLHFAAKSGLAFILEDLLTDEPVDSKTADGSTPLHLAVVGTAGYTLQCTHILLLHGASVNARDQWHRTPLMLACASSVDACDKVSELLTHGADVDAEDCHGYTALMHAVEGPYAIELLDELLTADPDFSKINHSGQSVLEIAQSRVSHMHQLREKYVVSMLSDAIALRETNAQGQRRSSPEAAGRLVEHTTSPV